MIDDAITALRNGAEYRLSGRTLTINDVPMVLTDAEFDLVWDVLDEIEGDNAVFCFPTA